MKLLTTTERDPFNHLKNIHILVNRELKEFEKIHVRDVLNKPEDVVKIYETNDGSNWNLMLLNKGYFLSIPRKANFCSASIYGSLEHALKYNVLIEL